MAHINPHLVGADGALHISGSGTSFLLARALAATSEGNDDLAALAVVGAVGDLQEVLSAAVGGMALTRTVEGRERFPIRLRYARELRASPEALSMLLVPTATGLQVPLNLSFG